MFRDKIDRVEDISKAIYTLERLKEKEVEHRDSQVKSKDEVIDDAIEFMRKHREEHNHKTPEATIVDMLETYSKSETPNTVKTRTAGQYLDEIYFHHDDLLKRLLNADYEWLARDQDGGLWASRVKPKKYDNVWDDVNDDHSTIIKNDDLPEVKWSDNEPTKISELLAKYENGGENGKQEERA
jgi:hypothetical protein